MASSVGDIIERITEYIQIKTELFKLKIIGHVSRILASVIALVLVGVLKTIIKLPHADFHYRFDLLSFFGREKLISIV